ncbi:MAG TPA: DUF1015 domain-containing protein [Acidimicrobiales bacterium]|nr:DUF1015 domain-containing protein [Acidimicrobiales bacterium]
MPRFEPFAGIRYDPEKVSLGDVVAPPYDVIGPEDQAALEARSPYNAVRVELARDEGGHQRYELANRRLESWLADGILTTDSEPGFYIYGMGYRDEQGQPRQTTGVLGALALDDPTGVLPHERTMAKPKHDRLNLLRATRANLSPIWGLSLAGGLSGLCQVTGPPIARCTDAQGVHHRLWRATEPGLIEAIKATVAAAPVVIADGHHRYATAIAYREERRAEVGPAPADHDLVLAYVVELADDEITVGAIHRAISGLPEDFDPVASVEGFSPRLVGELEPDAISRAVAAGVPALLTARGVWHLEPDSGNARADDRTDAARFEEVLAGWPAHSLAYRHSPDDVVADLTKGEAQVGLFLMPPTVAQIAATARAGRRMPEKTSFFWPKPLTGLLFRRLAD